MTLDRESIEKKDFPVARRGYQPSAVDAHLTLLADEVEQLRRRSHSPTEPLATAVSERVRGIVEAAEASAAEILATAELEARELRMQATEAAQRARLEATGKAQREREEAAAQAQDYVSRLSSSISEMLERLDGMESELSALTASLRTGTERLRGELAALEDELEGVIAATASEVAGEEEPSAARRAVAPPARIREEAARGAPAAADLLQEEPAGTSSGQPAVGLSDDAEGAQLIALNMALSGTARDETDRYLAENFDLRDRQRLLDDVYASAGRA